ncbi:uncharacterized protein [Periplaneta americana]
METSQRSLNIHPLELDCNSSDESGEAGTPAPPPSPEFARYCGSPYPTPNHSRRRLCSSLKDIVEEEGCTSSENTPRHVSFFPRYSEIERFGGWRDPHCVSYSSEMSTDSLSILSKIDGQLADETSRLSLDSSMMFEGAEKLSPSEISEEDRKTRDMLIEKMKEHAFRTQQLMSTKKQANNTKQSETSMDDVIILNDDENDLSFDQDSFASPELHPGADDIVKGEISSRDYLDISMGNCESDRTNCQSKPIVHTSEMSHFSRLMSETDLSSCSSPTEKDDTSLSRNIFLGDLEHHYGEEKVDEALASFSMQSNEEEKESISYISDEHDHYSQISEDMIPARAPSPEFDIEIKKQKAHEMIPDEGCYEYSLISEAEEQSQLFLKDEEVNTSNNDKQVNTSSEDEEVNTSSKDSEDEEVNISSKDEEVNTSNKDKEVNTGSKDEEVNPSNEDEEVSTSNKDLQNNVKDADEDGGFLSVLSEAAMYHAALKNVPCDGADKKMSVQNSNKSFKENSNVKTNDVIHENGEDRNECHYVQCTLAKPVESSFHVTAEDSFEFGMKSEYLSSNTCQSVASIDECAIHNSTHGSSVHSHTVSYGREMDATSDLNESDMENMTDLKRIKSCSEEDDFHDTLEEMELMMKFGISYMMSSNIDNASKSCDVTGQESFHNAMSTPKNTRDKIKEFEDFGGFISKVDDNFTVNIGRDSRSYEEIHEKERDHEAYITEQSEANCLQCCKEEEHLDQVKSNICDQADTQSLRHVNGASDKIKTGKSQICENIRIIKNSQHKIVFPNETSPSFDTKNCASVSSENPSPFKMPSKPLTSASVGSKQGSCRSMKKSPLKTITMISPCKKSINYSKIMSPVGAYIKNTPSPSLMTIVKPKPCHVITPKRTTSSRVAAGSGMFEKIHSGVICRVADKGRENVDTSNIRPVLPVVTYRSVPSVKLDQPQIEKMPRMNDKMKKLIDTPRPHIIRHEGRVKVAPSSQVRNTKVASVKKLIDNDDSFIASSDGNGEISVVVRKQAMRSNTLGC